ncbi:MAG: acyltransferase family protein [Acidimicrobiia bacterium]
MTATDTREGQAGDAAWGKPVPTPRTPTIGYNPALDGIRAFAVLAVMFYHGDQDWARGGFLGVDAFFVLSGYLITSLLLVEWRATGTVSLSAFYARRGRRLLPALFLMLGFVGIYAVAWADPTTLDKLRGDALSTLFYVANWRFIVTDLSYFDLFTRPSPLTHMWSLAIEEQWYFVWPLALTALLRIKNFRRYGAFVIFGLALGSASLMLALYDPATDPNRVYFGTDTRAQSLLLGAGLAFVIQHFGTLKERGLQMALQIAGLLAAAFTLYFWSTTADTASWLYRYGLLGTAVCVGIVIAAIVQPEPGPLKSILSLTPIVWIGKISYGLYLWHWPLYVVLNAERTGLTGAPLLIVRVAATFGVASLSYYLVEMPIRHGAMPGWRIKALAPAAIASLVVILLVTTADAEPKPTFAQDDRTLAELDRDSPDTPVPPDTAAAPGAPAGPIRVLVLGDSVAKQFGDGLSAIGAEKGLVVDNKASLGCAIARGDAVRGPEGELPLNCPWEQFWGEWTAEMQPNFVVLYTGQFDIVDKHVDGEWLTVGSDEYDEYFRQELAAAREAVTATGARLVLLTSNYSDPALSPSGETAYSDDNVDTLNDQLRDFGAHHPDDVIVLDLNKYISPDGQYTEAIDGLGGIREDDNVHFNATGQAYISDWLARKLRRLPPPT